MNTWSCARFGAQVVTSLEYAATFRVTRFPTLKLVVFIAMPAFLAAIANAQPRTAAQEAFLDAAMLQQKGLRVSNRVCVFVNGVPEPGVGLLHVNVGAVDFIEVYEQTGDHTSILRDRWRGCQCAKPTAWPIRAPRPSAL